MGVMKEIMETKLPAGFSFKICTQLEFEKIVGTLTESIFADNTLSVWPRQFMSELENEKLKILNQNYVHNYDLYLVILKENQLVGWSFGIQDGKESFLMASSAVLPEFRGQGFYGHLLDEVLKTVSEKGFQRIWSMHSMTNNQIIIPKLKRGFFIAGTRLNEMAGAMVELVYLPNQIRKELMDFRVGYRPRDEVKKLLQL